MNNVWLALILIAVAFSFVVIWMLLNADSQIGRVLAQERAETIRQEHARCL